MEQLAVENKIKDWVLQNLNSMQNKLKVVESQEAASQLLTDYDLMFSGALSALQVVGIAESVMSAIKLTMEVNKLEQSLIERRLLLSKSLSC